MWKSVKLGDVCNISSSKRIFAKEYQTSGIPFYRGKEIIEKHNGNKVSTELYITHERYEEIKNKFDVPRKGDILLSSVGTLGVPWLVDEEEFYFKDGNLTWLRVGTELLPEYLYLWLNSREAQNQIDMMCIGSTQKALTIDTLKKFDIQIPDIGRQRKIIDIMYSVINKIDTNREINKNLEDQAGIMLGNLLDNCRNLNRQLVKLGDYLYIKGRIGWKGLKKDEYLEQSGFRIINGETLTKEGIDWTKAGYITEERYVESPEIMLQIGDILLSKDGTIGKIGYVDTLDFPSTVASGIFVIRNQQPEIISTAFIYYLLKSRLFTAFIAARTEGSVIPHLYQKDFLEFEFPFPTVDEMNEYNAFAEPVLATVMLNMQENIRLIDLREALLPKLMSGEIDISEIDLSH